MRNCQLVALIFSLLTLPLQAGNLVAILVCDTLADQLEELIPLDLKLMQIETQKIASFTEMPLTEIVLCEHDATPQNLIDTLKELTLNEDDTVLFYFSGHGFRTQEKGENKWPYLHFCAVYQGIDFDFVTHILKEKGPRLVISIADCCNSLLSEREAPPVLLTDYTRQQFQKEAKYNYRKLFVESAGVITISASKPGESAWASYRGGIFTLALLEALEACVYSDCDLNWQYLLAKAANTISRHQHPQFDIQLKETAE